jgi:hypothetical protein
MPCIPEKTQKKVRYGSSVLTGGTVFALVLYGTLNTKNISTVAAVILSLASSAVSGTGTYFGVNRLFNCCNRRKQGVNGHSGVGADTAAANVKTPLTGGLAAV